ncbi:MAG TPA: flagellar hook capping FlgD N-terminal domain-containing protein [bacterium]|nr:flagellar hook capping FlgD N-terminal domain-containing protein [bacterium]
MLVDLIDQYSATQLGSASTTSNDTLGKDAFLNLLVAEMKYQDPLDPMQNEDFIAELAQFNSLEQMMQLNDSFEQMLIMQNLTQANTFIGLEVSWFDSEGNAQSGVVDAVEVISSEPMLIVGNEIVSTSDIFAISKPSE